MRDSELIPNTPTGVNLSEGRFLSVSRNGPIGPNLSEGRFLATAGNTTVVVNLSEGRFLASVENSPTGEKLTEGRFLAAAGNVTVVTNLSERRFRGHCRAFCSPTRYTWAGRFLNFATTVAKNVRKPVSPRNERSLPNLESLDLLSAWRHFGTRKVAGASFFRAPLIPHAAPAY